MPIIVVECPTPADASQAKTEADSGTLWGVSLGTTTSAETKEASLGIQATQTRCVKLLAGAPAEWMAWTGAVHTDSPWEDQSAGLKASYFLGVMA
mgnify:CR=1 FL=1